MPNKKFLETYPLYKKMYIELAYYQDNITDISKPAINLYCKTCKSNQTFNMINEYWENEADNTRIASSIEIWGRTIRALYKCSACNSYRYLFFIEFVKTGKSDQDENIYTGYIRKVGQNPPWEVEMDKKLEELLEDHASLYKKALICESQSYGIGAHAYYRRIIEKVIDGLLNQIPDLIESEGGKKTYLEALELTKKEKNAANRIKLVKDLLPQSLKPDNLNPLDIIYSSLSEGLHEKDDDECLELAEAIRTALIFLVKEVSSQKSTRKSFTESMKKLLEAKNKK